MHGKCIAPLLMITEACDVKKTPAHMILLQHYVPVSFNLIKNLGSYPHHLLAPILQTLVDKAEAPFSGQKGVHDEKPSILSVDELHHLGFFPQRIVHCTSDQVRPYTRLDTQSWWCIIEQ